jgi:serine/threonine-protein kinase HipA
MSTLAEVKLWGSTIGAVSLNDEDDVAVFEYAPEFTGSGIEVAPITMPLSRRIYSRIVPQDFLRTARPACRLVAG